MRLILAEDNELFRAALRNLVEARGFEVVGEASDGQRVIELAVELEPDLVLMDLSMPILNGIEATRQLTALLPAVKVVILTGTMDHKHDLYEALRAGAHGFLLKDFEADNFFAILHRAVASEPAVTQQTSPRVLQPFPRVAADSRKTA
jgi:DNA-binding NarL/FixJ family response regulator